MTPAAHFQLLFFGAVREVLSYCAAACGSTKQALARFPFLEGYARQIEAHRIPEWQASSQPPDPRPPIARLQAAARLDSDALLILMLAGLPEEDGRFGALYAELQGMPAAPWPTVGLLTSWWLSGSHATPARSAVQRLLSLGVLAIANPQSPRPSWALQTVPHIWDALHGEPPASLPPFLRHAPSETLRTPDNLLLPEPVAQLLPRVAALEAVREISAIVVRGPQSNGRRTLLGAIARVAGRGMLQVTGVSARDDGRCSGLGPLCILLDAMPVVVLDPAPGETIELPEIAAYDGPVGIVLPLSGGASGRALASAVTIDLPMPDLALRCRIWKQVCPVSTAQTLAESHRCASGALFSIATLARSLARMEGLPEPAESQVRDAVRALHRQHLDSVAEYVEPPRTFLIVPESTRRELRNLESRCRRREELNSHGGGVRILMRGPSGTGKTLAAQTLAESLGKSLYRIQLAAVVDKYLGETEKRLHNVLSRAEELDVVLLLDEGDALLGQRTNIRSSNDRYANLETNFMLQRLESFSGIIVITTNAGDRIDQAFERRLDVVIDFPAPDGITRLSLWQAHLPGDAGAIDPFFLEEIAVRCQLTGGQIRAAVLHARVLAMEDGETLGARHIEAAIEREYRKSGGICPLRASARVRGLAHAR
jgi:hypothetical protein